MMIYIFVLLSFILAQDSTSISLEVIDAIQDYENLIDEFPEMKGLNFNLANIHSKTGDMESAMSQYQQTLSSDDTQLRAHALYNMGNLQFENGNVEESSKLFREALKLSPEDEDILHNYALSQKVLKEQQKEEKQQNQNKEGQDNKEDQEKQEKPKNSDQNKENKDQEKQDSSDQKDSESQDQELGDSEEKENQEEKEQKEDELQASDGPKKDEEKGKEGQPQSKELTEEEKLNLQEAEAILNALKADKDNLKKKKYKAKGRVKLEKDW